MDPITDKVMKGIVIGSIGSVVKSVLENNIGESDSKSLVSRGAHRIGGLIITLMITRAAEKMLEEYILERQQKNKKE